MPTEWRGGIDNGKIKRCPHCDSYFGMVTYVMGPWHWHLRCEVCGWESKPAWTRRGAVRNWNNDDERLVDYRASRMEGR